MVDVPVGDEFGVVLVVLLQLQRASMPNDR